VDTTITSAPKILTQLGGYSMDRVRSVTWSMVMPYTANVWCSQQRLLWLLNAFCEVNGSITVQWHFGVSFEVKSLLLEMCYIAVCRDE